jgi:hypothetical protein
VDLVYTRQILKDEKQFGKLIPVSNQPVLKYSNKN